MPSALIVGSGPAAAGAALALCRRPDQQVTVIDLGGRLDVVRQQALDTMAAAAAADWSPSDRDLITEQPVQTQPGVIPEKRSYGSDYPFRDLGQLAGIRPVGTVNGRVISGAYGGFSNVWGAQIMPFNPPTLARWPIRWPDLEPHYRAVLEEVPLAGEGDDLASLFPLVVTPTPLPPLADRSRMVLERYDAHRARVRALGVIVGRARIAMRADACIRCGLCMTGCPYGLIYSASQTFDRLRGSGRVTYHPNLLAYRVGEEDGRAVVGARDVVTGDLRAFTADRVFLACGAIGTTRLVLGSLQQYGTRVVLGESVQFVVPALSRRPTPDPRGAADFTLNQFNVLVDLGGDGADLSQIHFYTYNPAFLAALPALLRHPRAAAPAAQLLRRLTVGFGYLPSWMSPRLEVRARAASEGALPELTIDQTASATSRSMMGLVVRRLIRAAPSLDLWPILGRVGFSPGGKSYHFGGSFPHGDGPGSPTRPVTDRLGRLPQWRRVHLVDASVFPTVPATTFTLTVIANAHRIASEAADSAPS